MNLKKVTVHLDNDNKHLFMFLANSIGQSTLNEHLYKLQCLACLPYKHSRSLYLIKCVTVLKCSIICLACIFSCRHSRLFYLKCLNDNIWHISTTKVYL